MPRMSGPAPTFCPVFPEDFLQQARQQARRKTVPYQAVQRFRLALLLHEEPDLGHAEAGQHVGLSGSQVRRWRQRWSAGDFSVADAPGRGRKAAFSPVGPGPGQGRSL
jgi:Homeodomain-like domain-containing protein